MAQMQGHNKKDSSKTLLPIERLYVVFHADPNEQFDHSEISGIANAPFNLIS